MPMAQGMNEGTRRWRRDPLAVAGLRGDAAVKRARSLHRHKRHAGDDVFVEGLVHCRGFLSEQPNGHVETMLHAA